MSDPLAVVRESASARKLAEADFRASLQAARDAGLSAARIAEAAGVSRQRVLQVTMRPAAVR